MYLLTDGEKTLLLLAIVIVCLLAITAIFLFFKSMRNRYGSIAGIMRNY